MKAILQLLALFIPVLCLAQTKISNQPFPNPIEGYTLQISSGVPTWAAVQGVTIPNTITPTNFVLNTVYTNLSGSVQLFDASVALITTGVNGNSAIDLMVDQAGGTTFKLQDRCAISTLVTSIAQNYTNNLTGALSNNATYYVTNSSTGSGDSSAIVPGTGELITLSDGAAAGLQPVLSWVYPLSISGTTVSDAALTNNETRALTFSNNVTVDAAHTLAATAVTVNGTITGTGTGIPTLALSGAGSIISTNSGLLIAGDSRQTNGIWVGPTVILASNANYSVQLFPPIITPALSFANSGLRASSSGTMSVWPLSGGPSGGATMSAGNEGTSATPMPFKGYFSNSCAMLYNGGSQIPFASTTNVSLRLNTNGVDAGQFMILNGDAVTKVCRSGAVAIHCPSNCLVSVTCSNSQAGATTVQNNWILQYFAEP